MSHTVIQVSRVIGFWLLILVACIYPSDLFAQTYQAEALPVLEPITDLNGVDVKTGTLVTRSPLTIEAPGASQLQFNSAFNGRRASFNLNAYIDDNTYLAAVEDRRDIRVHISGRDYLFHCYGYGSCTDRGNTTEGTNLTRSAGDMYVYTSRDGVVYTFFSPYINQLPPLGPECQYSDCNYAGYAAYAFVQYIQYPSGEKLTFDTYPTSTPESGGYRMSQSVQSNLGYTLTFKLHKVLSSPVSVAAGIGWVGFGFDSMDATLKKGATVLGSISRNIVSSGPGLRQVDVTEQDGIGRSYSLRTKPVHSGMYPCNFTVAPTRSVSPMGVVTDVTYDGTVVSSQQAPGNYYPVRSVSRSGQTWLYSWGGQLTATSPGGRAQTIVSGGRASSFDDLSGCDPTNEGYVLQHTDALNRLTAYQYDPSSYALTRGTFPESNGYRYEYDARKNLTRIIQESKPSSGLTEVVVYKADYDLVCSNPVKCNKPNWIEDAKGNATGVTYDRTDLTYDPIHGGLLTATLPADASGIRRVITYTYEAYNTGNGIIYRVAQTSACIVGTSCLNTANEERTVTTYWENTFLPASVTRRSGDGTVTATTAYIYDAAGRPVQVTRPKGNHSYTRYDGVGRKVGEIAALADGYHQAKRFTYNAADQLTLQEAGTVLGTSDLDWAGFAVRESLAIDYDIIGRKIRETRTGGAATQVTQFSYDADNRLTCTAVRMNPAVFGSLPADACTLGTAGSAGADRITRNIYDDAGQLLKVQKAVGTDVQIDYARYEYTGNGKQKAVIDANGNRAEFAYDGFDRRVKWTFPSTTVQGSINAADYEEYGYDANGNRTTLRKRDGRTIAYAYDALNRVTSKTYPGGGARAVYYAYDLRGLQTEARFDSASGGDAILSAWDGLGRQASSTTAMGGTSRTLTYAYDANGNRTRIMWPDGQHVDSSWDALDRLYYSGVNGLSVGLIHTPYDSAGRLSGFYRYNISASNWAFPTIFSYDNVSRLASYSHWFSNSAANVSTAFTYNPASQIVSRTRDNDDYRFTGNVNIDRAYATNGLNQYSTAGSASFTYDANGNLTSDGTISYTYDIENRLVGTSTGVTLSYDPLGRLEQTSSPPTGTTHFLYDGDALVAEYDGAGNMLKRYVHGPAEGQDDPLVEYIGSSTASPRYLYADHQGSIVAIADSNGHRIAVNGYDEYGIPNGLAGTGTPNTGRFQYTGQAWIPELGMYHYKARVYSPTLGRFLQTDPIGYDDQINLYAYVANDPISKYDPSGKAGCVTTVTTTAGGVKGATTRTTICDGKVSATLFAILSAVGAEGLINKNEEVDGSDEKEDPRTDGERGRHGEEVITGGKQPQGKEGIDNRGEGRSVTGTINDAAAEAGVKAGKTADGNPTVVLPNGNRVTGYPESGTTGGPTISITTPKGRVKVKTREDYF